MEPYEDLNSLCQRIENERLNEGFTEFAAIKGKKAGTLKSVREYADLSHVIFQEKKRSWSPDRERWVLWTILSLMEQEELSFRIAYRGFPVQLALPGLKRQNIIKKIFDFAILSDDNTLLIADVKTNIDLVEKDLYKLFLLSEAELIEYPVLNSKPKDLKTLQSIWEGDGNNRWSKDPRSLSHEAALIELAKIKGHLDEYLYVPFNDEAFVKDQLSKVRTWLSSIF